MREDTFEIKLPLINIFIIIIELLEIAMFSTKFFSTQFLKMHRNKNK